MFDPKFKLPSGQVATLKVSWLGGSAWRIDHATVDFGGTDAEIEVKDIIALAKILEDVRCDDATCPWCLAGIPCH